MHLVSLCVVYPLFHNFLCLFKVTETRYIFCGFQSLYSVVQSNPNSLFSFNILPAYLCLSPSILCLFKKSCFSFPFCFSLLPGCLYSLENQMNFSYLIAHTEIFYRRSFLTLVAVTDFHANVFSCYFKSIIVSINLLFSQFYKSNISLFLSKLLNIQSLF